MQQLKDDLKALKTKRFWLSLIAWLIPKLKTLLDKVKAEIDEKNATINAIALPKKKNK